jgi:Zn finger protein HypA/HybF involved in hydrogenase expression
MLAYAIFRIAARLQLHQHSIYVQCRNCFMFGTPMADLECGNCGSSETVLYWPFRMRAGL